MFTTHFSAQHFIKGFKFGLRFTYYVGGYRTLQAVNMALDIARIVATATVFCLYCLEIGHIALKAVVDNYINSVLCYKPVSHLSKDEVSRAVKLYQVQSIQPKQWAPMPTRIVRRTV